jgi:hypothetical protein
MLPTYPQLPAQVGLGATTPAAPMSTGAKVAIVAAVGVVGFIAWDVLLKKPASAKSRAYPNYDPIDRSTPKPGWYTILYNYPVGNRDRRIKGGAGPFATKAEAQAEAEREKSVWYPVVRKIAAGQDPYADKSRRRRRRR